MAKRAAAGRKGTLGATLAPESPLGARVLPGKQALHGNEHKVDCDPPSFVTDSLALDDAYARSEPGSPRWDYLLGTEDGGVVGLEVHPATPGEVDRLIRKKQWAEAKVEEHSRRGVGAWYWAASGSSGLSKTTTEFRRLGKSGITFVGQRLRLSR